MRPVYHGSVTGRARALAWLRAIRPERRPELLVFLPALALGVLWAGGEGALLALASGLPLAVLLLQWVMPGPLAVPVSDQVIDRLDAALRDTAQGSRQTGCFVLQFDDPSWLCDRHGRTRQSEILAACVARIRGAMRPVPTARSIASVQSVRASASFPLGDANLFSSRWWR